MIQHTTVGRRCSEDILGAEIDGLLATKGIWEVIVQLQVTTHWRSDDLESGKLSMEMKVFEIGRSSWRVGSKIFCVDRAAALPRRWIAHQSYERSTDKQRMCLKGMLDFR